MAELVILEPAQRELEEIAQLHLNLVGPNSARKITDLILDTLSRLETFPLSGHIPQDKELRNAGYRLVIAGKYICVYRLVAQTVFVYHIAHGASNYPVTFKQLLPPFAAAGKIETDRKIPRKHQLTGDFGADEGI